MSSTFRCSIAANIVLTATVALLLWRNHLPALARIAALARPVAVRSEPSPHPVAVIPEPPPKFAGHNLTPATIAQLEQVGISRDSLVSEARAQIV